ncbi:MAG: nitrous oxide reductase family maturation protein NosD [Candidatus Hermodarchaeota archaeon]
MKSNRSIRIINLYLVLGFILTISVIFCLNLSPSNKFNYTKPNEIIETGEEKEDIKLSEISEKIHINNNWSAAKALGICSGSGNFSDPYKIEDLNIDGKSSGSCILIENSIVYFKIENCTVFNSGKMLQDAGIKLINITNGFLINNNCSSNITRGVYLKHCDNNSISNNNASAYLEFSNHTQILGNKADFVFLNGSNNKNFIEGNFVRNIYLGINSSNNVIEENNPLTNSGGDIFLINCDNNIILNNNVTNTGLGIYLYRSNNNTIQGNHLNNTNLGIISFYSDNNTILNNTVNFCDNGISLASCSYAVLSGNDMNKIGLVLTGTIEEMSSHQIDNTNLIDEKPIYYYKNQEKLNSNNFTNAGQVILVRCNDSTIISVNTSYCSIGIALYYCNTISVSNSTVCHNVYGFYLRHCKKTTILRNSILYNIGDAINLLYGDEQTISGNNIRYNNGNGIVIGVSNDNVISGNVVNYNEGHGLILAASSNTRISGNTITYNADYGIYLLESNYNLITGNTLIGNNQCIIEENCVENTFRDNTGCFYGEPAINVFGNFLLFAIIFLVSLVLFNLFIRDQRIVRKFKVYAILISVFTVLILISYFFVNTTIIDFLDPFNLNEFTFEFPDTITMNNFLLLIELVFFGLSLYRIYKLDVRQAVLFGFFPCVLKGVEFFSMLFVLSRMNTFFNFYVELELAFYFNYLPWMGICYIYFILFRSTYFKEISEEEQHVKIKELELRERIISKKERLIDPLFKFEEKDTLLEQRVNVYVSFAEEDSEIFKINDFIKGLVAFDDINQVYSPGTDVEKEFLRDFENQIKKFDLVISFCSPSALKTDDLLKFWQKIKTSQKVMIPVYIDPQHVPRFLKSYKKVEFDAFNFEENLNKIKEIINREFKVRMSGKRRK